MDEPQDPQPGYEQLLSAKAEKLQDLLKRKPGQKGYKRSLIAFLEADAEAQRRLLHHVEQTSNAASVGTG